MDWAYLAKSPQKRKKFRMRLPYTVILGSAAAARVAGPDIQQRIGSGSPMLHQSHSPETARIQPVVTSRTLSAFCREVGEVLHDVPDAEAPARVAEMLPGLLATPGLLEAEQRVVPPGCPYGRHTIFLCPGDRFSVLAMVWPAGVVSPIHDHLTWCAFGVYEGVLRQTMYVPTGRERDGHKLAEATRADILCAGECGSLPVDEPDIHAMSNPTGRDTISIHVYGGNAAKQGPNLKAIYTPV
jgi:predicted metal-dependent enzyme (double-stranded beta helix superfamily)